MMTKKVKLLFLTAIFVIAFMPAQSLGFPIATTPRKEMARSAAFDGTNYLVAFEKKAVDGTHNIMAQFISPDGALVGPPVALGLQGGAPTVAFDGANYLVVTDENTYVYGQFISPSGTLIGSPLYITTGGIDLGEHLILFDGNNYFVTWNDNRDLKGQFVSPAGTLVGGAITICSGTAPENGGPSPFNISFDGNNILAVWADGRRPSSGGCPYCPMDIYGQFISASGAPGPLIGSNFPININDDWSDMSTMGLAFDGTNYLVAWNDMTPNSHNARLYSQLVSTAGALVGNVISIGEPAANKDRDLPFLAFDGNDYLLSWTSTRNDVDEDMICDSAEGTCWDMYAQYISKSGVLIDEPFSISAGPGNEFGGIGFGGGKYLALIDKVDTFDGNIGDIYGKFIEPRPHVALLTANGETISSGATYAINWESHPDAVSFDIKYSSDKGLTWSTVATGLTGTSFPSWSVPKSKNNKRRHLIKILGRNAAQRLINKDKSDRPFSIEVVKLTYPNGGETLTVGATPTITWTTNATKKLVAKVILSYTLNNGVTWKPAGTIKDSNPGTFDWTVPTVSSAKTKCKIKVVLKDSLGNSLGNDTSDAVFTIQP